ncbi:MAG: hypothetical protein RI935_560 [Candidatus Parcubacteria bacterium]
MSLNEVQDKLENLCKNISPEVFIFNLLEIYEFPKTTILKLKKETDHSVVKIKNKLYFKVTTTEEDEHVAVDDLSKNKDVLKLNPRFIVVTDYDNFVAIDTKKTIDDPSRTLDIKITDLYKRYDFFAPWLGVESYQVDKETVADIKAANKMAKLYDQILSDNPDFYTTNSSDLNLLLSRLLFCFFAEDTGIFEKNLFTNSVLSNSDISGSNLSVYIERVFDVFNIDYKDRTEKHSDINNFPYVNGGLFKDRISIPKFTKKTRDLLEDCGNLDWSEINPDIFGSMIQAVVHPNQRENLGMHYTSVPNIMKLIRPLFLDDLYEDYFNSVGNRKKLEELRKRISNIKVFDPACGSGNFLIISYKELCKLEALILKQIFGDNDRLDLDITFSAITLNNFYGIEIDDFAHDVAKLSLYLAQHQVNVMFEKEFGKLKPILPLKESGNIKCANSARSNWEEFCQNQGEVYLVSNPPYLGARVQDITHKEDMSLVLNKFESYNNLDYISVWFVKGAYYISNNKNAKLAFVSTNSVCQGEQVALLWPKIFDLGVEIFFAYQSFKWQNNAKHNAGVTVIIVGLCNVGIVKNKKIFIGNIETKAKNINPYLSNSGNIYIKSRTSPLSDFPEMSFGSMPNDGGNLMLENNEYSDLIKNVPGVKKFVRKILGAEEFISGTEKYCIWVEDKDLEEANKIPFLRDRFDMVSKFRDKSSRKATQKLAFYSHRFAENRHKNKSCIVIPGISSEKRTYIPIGFISKEYIINNRCYIIPTDEIYLFGVLTSLMHMIWVRAVAGKLETRLSYSKDIVYNNFPFPSITQKQKELITNQVYNILDEREKYPGKTFAELYDSEKMPHGLKQAHEFLDEVIDKIYRVKPFDNDEERLDHLFKLYEEMVEKEKQEKKK